MMRPRIWSRHRTSRGGGSVKTLTVALDGQTRVELGERTADDKYPVYWQEGDALRINEGATTAIAIHEDKSVADFTFAVADADVYNVVYPYVEGLTAATEGCLPVKFAEVQNYTEGSFDAASFPMYGYAEGEELTGGLNYLAGVLAFEVAGNGEVLKKIELTVTDGAIAGTFDVNCQTGELKAQADASKKLTYMLPAEGLTLSTTPVVLYVAVPAGDYGTMQAKFCTTDVEVAMNAGVPCAGDKAVKAGVVREFKNILFVDNSADMSGVMFEVYDETTLQQFASLCAAGTFEYGGVTVKGSFEVSEGTAAAWVPVEGFSGVFEGNGNTITGMTKPLFGTTTGTIRNLNFKTNVTITDALVWGAVAQVVTSTADQRGRVEGCTLVEGSTITYAYEGEVAVAVAEEAPIRVGGLVGSLQGGDIVSCKNYAAFSCLGVGSAALTYNTCFGAIVGYADGYQAAAEEENPLVIDGLVTKCHNYGAIAVSAKSANSYIRVGGVVGSVSNSSLANLSNSAAITATGVESYSLNLGGVFAHARDTVTREQSFEDCSNTGNITVDATTSIVYNLVGGVAAQVGKNLYKMYRFKNTGNIFTEPVVGAAATGEVGNYQVGGIIGRLAAGFIYDSVNGVEGDPTQGTLTQKGVVKEIFDNVSISVAGVAAYQHGTNTATGCVNHANILSQVTNEDKDSNTILAAGIFGYCGSTNAASAIEDCTNYGNVKMIYGNKTVVRVGGVGAYVKPRTINVANYGDIELELTGEITQITMGGCIGYKSDSGVLYHAYNGGSVDFKMKENTPMTDIFLGGIAGQRSGTYMGGTLNEGAITVTSAEGATARRAMVGGLVGYVTYPFHEPDVDGPYTGNHNKGKVSVQNLKLLKSGSPDYNGAFAVGGCIGFNAASYGSIHSAISNEGDVTATGSTDANSYIGGLAGSCASGFIGDAARALDPADKEYYTNKGNVTVAVNSGATQYVAGCYGYGRARLEGLVNRGKVSTSGTVSVGTYLGGVFGYKARVAVDKGTGMDVISCVNYGEIVAAADYGAGSYVGGVCGATHGGHSEESPGIVITDNINYGPVTASGSCVGHLYLGGAHGYINTDFASSVVNHGAVTVSGDYKTLRMGGVVGQTNAVTITGLTNTGAVVVEATAEVAADNDNYLGGCLGFSAIDTGEKALTITDCENSGLVSSSMQGGGGLRIGGVAGSTVLAPIGLTLKSTGTVTVAAGTYKYLLVGGIAGMARGQKEVDNCVNEGAAVTVAEGVDVTGKYAFPDDDTNASGSAIGGIFGCYLKTDSAASVDGLTSNLSNAGAVTCAASFTEGDLLVGGLIGYTSSDYKTSQNTGNVTVSGPANIVWLGGCVGLQPDQYADSISTNTNSGDVSLSSQCAGQAYLGGVMGFSNGGSSSCTNNGALEFSGSCTYLRLGGVLGGSGYSSFGNHTNNGAITVSGTTTTGYIAVGGVIGWYTINTTKGSTNNGNITFTDTASSATTTSIGGCIGQVNSKAANSMSGTTPMLNTGTIVHRGTVGTNCYIGGVVGVAASKNASAVYHVKTCQFGSESIVPVLRFAGEVTETLYIGLICGATDSPANNENVNYGAMMITGTYYDIKGEESSQFGYSDEVEFKPTNI